MTGTPRDEMRLAYALQNEAAHTARVLAPRTYYGKPSRRMARHPAPARKVRVDPTPTPEAPHE